MTWTCSGWIASPCVFPEDHVLPETGTATEFGTGDVGVTRTALWTGGSGENTGGSAGTTVIPKGTSPVTDLSYNDGGSPLPDAPLGSLPCTGAVF